MARDLQGMHIVVVGATGVLGSKIAAHLSQAGTAVSGIVRKADQLDSATVSRHVVADITNTASLRAAFEQLAPFDGVINAAGVVAFGNITEVHDKTLTDLFAINSIAPIVMLRESAPHITTDGFFLNISAGKKNQYLVIKKRYDIAVEQMINAEIADKNILIENSQKWLGYYYRISPEQATWNMHKSKINYDKLIQKKWREKWTN